MVAGIATFLIIHVVDKRKNVKEVGGFGRGQERNDRQAQGFTDILIMELR